MYSDHIFDKLGINNESKMALSQKLKIEEKFLHSASTEKMKK